MKVSIAWIFDHIDADWRTVDIEALVEKFNETTAEIEGWYAITIDSKSLFLGTALNTRSCSIADLKKEVSLSSWFLPLLGSLTALRQVLCCVPSGRATMQLTQSAIT